VAAAAAEAMEAQYLDEPEIAADYSDKAAELRED
jgi:hypothetical protein